MGEQEDLENGVPGSEPGVIEDEAGQEVDNVVIGIRFGNSYSTIAYMTAVRPKANSMSLDVS